MPKVTTIIAVYNEETNVESRIKNLLLSDYPSDKHEIAITGDGWTHLDNIDGPTLKLHILKIYRGIHRYKSGVVGVMGSRRKRKG